MVQSFNAIKVNDAIMEFAFSTIIIYPFASYFKNLKLDFVIDDQQIFTQSANIQENDDLKHLELIEVNI